MPSIDKLNQQYKNKGLAILGINDEEPETARGFLKKNNYTLTVLTEKNRLLRDHYGIAGVPTSVILDSKGRLVAQVLGTRDEAVLLRLLRRAGLK